MQNTTTKKSKNIFYLYNLNFSFKKSHLYPHTDSSLYPVISDYEINDQSKMISAINTRSVSPVFARP